MPSINYADRIKRLRAALKESALDAIVVQTRTNTRYLCGFKGSYSTLIVDTREARMVTDSRYAEIAEGAVKGSGVSVLCQPLTGLKEYYQGLFKASGYTRVGFEESITVREFDALKARVKGAKLEKAEDLILKMRAIKDAAELALIKKAVKLADAMMDYAMSEVKIGRTEEELSKLIRRAAEDLGGEGESFDNIVASGPNSSKPHHRGSPRKLRAGDPVTIDLGGVVGGYCSDLTRTPVIGKVSKKFEEIYNIVLAANEAAIDGLRPGMKGKEGDALAREVIKSAGYGEYFGHGTGHCVGLDIHESPRLSALEEAVFEPGMVVTIEPGIYLPGFGGVRIEDYCLVTEKGVQVLSRTPKELTILRG